MFFEIVKKQKSRYKIIAYDSRPSASRRQEVLGTTLLMIVMLFILIGKNHMLLAIVRFLDYRHDEDDCSGVSGFCYSFYRTSNQGTSNQGRTAQILKVLLLLNFKIKAF